MSNEINKDEMGQDEGGREATTKDLAAGSNDAWWDAARVQYDRTVTAKETTQLIFAKSSNSMRP